MFKKKCEILCNVDHNYDTSLSRTTFNIQNKTKFNKKGFRVDVIIISLNHNYFDENI